jgi:hypothetical protein
MMHAEVIELLSGKGQFSTEQAIVLARAMDMTIEKAQLVTVPVLDARFAAVNVRFTSLEARLDVLEAKLDAKMQRWAVLIIISVLVSQTALGPIGTTAMDGLQKALSTIVH